MGQYWGIFNIDKKEFLSPEDFYEGLKLMEFIPNSNGIMYALGALLAHGNGRGGGDLQVNHYINRTVSELDSQIIGSWAGDRIVIAGDYGDPGLYLSDEDIASFTEKEAKEFFSDDHVENNDMEDILNLYVFAHARYTNVSARIKAVLE